MCGIVGKIHHDPGRPVDWSQIEQMAQSVGHRGPDDQGVWVEGNVGLGHRRLSIIDLSVNGRNPMCNEDGSTWIVFNGEVYNFQELRRELEGRGHRFKSRTDTEVVLHGYEEWGAECVQRFRGMFAFAIWNSETRELLLARDRLGVKPLFYSMTGNGLLFGSELKAILASGEVETTPDFGSIHQFLLWQCIPSPRTCFEQIKKLPPACVLRYREGAEPEVRRYWRPDYGQPFEADEEKLTEQVRRVVQEATERRLIADVPIGIFLSGGIDSACVLASARRAMAGPIDTFSVGFGSEAFDESSYARLLALHFDTRHHEIRITPDAIELLPRMASLFDEPFADSSAIPTYYLCKYTSEFVKVALSGDGGDEAFGGYQRYLALKGFRFLSRFPMSRWLPLLHPLFPHRAVGRSQQRYIRDLLGITTLDSREQYRAIFLGLMNEERWKPIYSQSFRELLNGTGAGTFLFGWDECSAPDDVTRAMAGDTLSYIPEDLNVKVDISSMACGLEVRSPFLDHSLVEFSARIPSSLKIRGLKQKYILKKAFRDELPTEILRRKKAGFAVPISEWFRKELKDYTRDVLLSPDAQIAEIFSTKKVQLILEEHASGARNWHAQIWPMLVLENWFQAQTSRVQCYVA
jgi:asparagine synthase (glutamine-hydrolysing)